MMRMVTPRAYQVASYRLEHEDRPAWLALRREGLGGSDVGPIMDMDGHRTAWQVYLDKLGEGRLDDDMTERQAEYIEFGHEMEAVIARVWHRRMGGRGRLVRCGMLARADAPWLRVNLDRRCLGVCGDGPCLFEGKNRSAWQHREWDTGGDPDKVPDGPALQVQHGLMVTGYSHGHLVTAIGGNTLRHYRIEADEVLQKLLFEEESWFWHEHVLKRIPPPIDATERTGRILARMWQVDPGKVLTGDYQAEQLVASLRRVKAGAAEWAEDVKRREHELQELMGDAELLVGPDGKPLATWKANGTFREKEFRASRARVPARWQKTVRRIDTKAMADDDPAEYARWRARVFRVAAEPRGD